MYLFTILSAFICIEFITIASSVSSEVHSNDQLSPLESEIAFDNNDFLNDHNQNDEEDEFDRRTASFLRFGRQMSPPTGSFLRFGRQMSPSTGSFLRFGRQTVSPTGSFLRFGRSSHSFPRISRSGNSAGTFLRFGRQAQETSSNHGFRSSGKGDFLRFG